MALNKLIAEAIADAEVLTESAKANAKLQIEQDFAPQLQTLISQRLREADKDEWYRDSGTDPLDENEDELAEDNEVEEGADPHPATKADSFGKVEEAKETVEYKSSGVGSSGESGIAQGEGLPDTSTPGPNPSLTSSDIGNDSETSGDPDRGAAKGDKEGGEYYHDSGPDPLDEAAELEEAFGLDDIIRELQKDVEMLTQASGGEFDDEETYGDDDEAEGGEDLGLDIGPDAEAGEDPFGGEAPEDEFGDDDEDDIDLEEILREIEAEAEVNESAQMVAENTRLKSELDEALKAISLLRDKLNEVNLLNAKLFHTTKLFRAGVTSEQKQRIVEQFDRATTIREVKLLYSALAETILESRKTSGKAATKKIVAEGLASSAGGSTAPKVINEQTNSQIVSDDSVRRMQELAGIFKEKK